jgi:hypothetical protein
VRHLRSMPHEWAACQTSWRTLAGRAAVSV